MYGICVLPRPATCLGNKCLYSYNEKDIMRLNNKWMYKRMLYLIIST